MISTFPRFLEDCNFLLVSAFFNINIFAAGMNQEKIKVGILFGGSSREREISFAGGRTVYDSLNRDLFEPIPIFIDSFHNFVLLKWEHIYKGSIRDFYPNTTVNQEQSLGIPLYAESFSKEEEKITNGFAENIGKIIPVEKLATHIDFAFLALHGTGGEDGSIQGLLSFFNIPFSGSGMLSSTIGMDKAFQKKFTQDLCPTMSFSLTKNAFSSFDLSDVHNKIEEEIGFPCVIRPANQGSSIGVSIINQNCDLRDLRSAIDEAFFCYTLQRETWLLFSESDKLEWLTQFAEVRSHLGFPVMCKNVSLYNPKDLLNFIEIAFTDHQSNSLLFEAFNSESEILFESFIDGKEFSCIVVRDDDGKCIALPPTEIQKGNEIYDYRSKYLPGLSRKITPIDLSNKQIVNITKQCKTLFERFNFNVYARIDGFIQEDGTIYLNDPNTTSGMLPSSFFFHQAAEIGLNPSQFLTFIIRNSIAERINQPGNSQNNSVLLQRMELLLSSNINDDQNKKRIGIVLGGYSSERHISVESGRNIYEKLSSSSIYDCVPYFLKKENDSFALYEIPINILLKDNADDIAEKIDHSNRNEFLTDIRNETVSVVEKYAPFHNVAQLQEKFEPSKISFEQLAENVDFVFIALHGRPGEDGELQQHLEQFNIPYNGSQPFSSEITIDKYNTLQLLKEHGFKVANQRLIQQETWSSNPNKVVEEIEVSFTYPFIAKPQDDGCSSAVKLLHNRKELESYLRLIFRSDEPLNTLDLQVLKMQAKEEFPRKNTVLFEQFIAQENAKHFLEVTGGLLCHYNNGSLEYEMFEPSETLSSSSILSLEEKFLAGEGQNITPARFHTDQAVNQKISQQVQGQLKKAAAILKVEGYARIDAFVRIFDDHSSETIIIEVNSLPGMTPATCIFHQAAINHYKPFNFIHKIIEFGLERKNKELV